MYVGVHAPPAPPLPVVPPVPPMFGVLPPPPVTPAVPDHDRAIDARVGPGRSGGARRFVALTPAEQPIASASAAADGDQGETFLSDDMEPLLCAREKS